MVIEQRSEEWFKLRRGKITSSEIHKIMGEKGLSQTAKTYLLERVCELFGGAKESASGQALDWGRDLEPLAISHYEEVTGRVVEKAPFIDVNPYYGGSPDGLILPDGIIEVKCPFNSANHFKHRLIDSPEKFKATAPNYYYQCISNMICAKATWCDFISFDPRVDEAYKMSVYRLELTPEETAFIYERLDLAVTYMVQLREEIEKTQSRLLLG